MPVIALGEGDRGIEREFLMFLFSYDVARRLKDEHDRMWAIGHREEVDHQPEWEFRTPGAGDIGLLCKCGRLIPAHELMTIIRPERKYGEEETLS